MIFSRSRSVRFDFALLVLLLATMGCSQTAEDLPELGQVTGVVTLDGQPLEGATVSFQSKEAGRLASGTTDTTGQYTLHLLNDIEGAPVGTNDVMITTVVPGEDGVPDSGRAEMLPPKYNSQSTLTADVQAGPNEFNFDLTSK